MIVNAIAYTVELKDNELINRQDLGQFKLEANVSRRELTEQVCDYATLHYPGHNCVDMIFKERT